MRKHERLAGSKAHRLRFEAERPKPPSMLRHTESAADALSDLLADAVLPADETEEEENVGVQAARTGRQGAESSVRRMSKQRQKKQIQRQYAAAQTGRQAEGIVVQGAGEAVFTPVQRAERTGRQGAESSVRRMSKQRQKKQIQRQYAAAQTGRQAEGIVVQGAGEAVFTPVQRAERKIEGFIRKNRGKLVILLLAVMMTYMLSSLSGCMPIAQSLLESLVIGTYPAEEDDLIAAERAYCEMEDALQDELDRYGEIHPGYDEVQVEQMEIWHDPYVLLALISARIGGEWTVDTAMPTLELLFGQQYKLTTSVEKETRCRTEWKKEYKQVEDPQTGEMKWRENWVQIEVAYTYTICKVKLVNKILSHLPFIVLSREKVGMYALYMATLGNYPDLFAGKPHASQLKEPMEYEVPEAYKQADPNFAKLIEAGERYIGYPYVWGGDSPETSFDCSGFISWIFKESGVRDVGRLGATSLYDVCTPIEPEEARPGDLIFFQGTLGDGVAGNDGITHVALYVGDGYILNCGNPISYADLSRAYWQEHFYGFGRMYE